VRKLLILQSISSGKIIAMGKEGTNATANKRSGLCQKTGAK